MRKLILLALLALPLVAQTGPPNLSACYVTTDDAGTIGDRQVMFKCTLSEGVAGYAFRIQYGYSDGSLTRRPPTGAGNGTTTLRVVRVADLDPTAGTIYWGPQVSNSAGANYSAIPACPATCTNCDSGDDPIFGDNGSGGSGVDCTAGQNWSTDLATLDASAPEDPVEPTITFDPAVPAAATTVSANGTCSDLSTLLATAETTVEGDGSVYRILVPPNVRCAPFQLKALTQGRIQIAPDVDAKLLPPPGSRVGPQYYPYMGLFTKDPASSGTWGSTTWTMEQGARGYDFIAIRTTSPVGADSGDYPASRMQILTTTGSGFPAASDMRWDRCAFDYPSGWDVSHLLNVTRSQNFVIRDSFIRNDMTDQVVSAAFSIYMSGTDGLQLLNNTFSGQAIIFGDTDPQEVVNFRMTGNDVIVPDAHSKAHPDWDGIYRRYTMCLELKACWKCDITGNHMKGCRADFNNNGPAIALTGVGPRQADMDISWNTLKKTAGGILIDENFSANATRLNYATERIRIQHNLMYGTDMNYNCSGSVCSQVGNTGPFLWVSDSVTDLKVTRNTYAPERGRRPNPLFLFGHRHQGFLYEDNILVVSRGDSSFFGVRKDITSFGMIPAPAQTTGKPAWDETVISGTALDTLSSFARNKFIPGIEGAATGTYSAKAASLADADTVAIANVTANAALSGWIGTGGNAYVGSASACGGGTCPDTLNDRLALAFESAVWKTTSTYADQGADIDALEARQGLTLNDTVYPAATSVTLTFTAPTVEACTVQISPWSTNYAGTWDDEATITEKFTEIGGRNKSVSFTGLSTTTKYGYRIFCKKEKFGNFTTGAPINSISTAATLFVATTGDDMDPCSLAAPCATIGQAASVAVPGDIIEVADGSYAAETISVSGTPAAPITIRAENAGLAIIDGNDSVAVGLTIADGSHWLVVEGIKIIEFTSRAIAVGSADGPNHDIVFRNVAIQDIGDTQCTGTSSGIVGAATKQTSETIWFDRMLVDNVGRQRPGEGGCSPPNENYKNHDHGFYLYGKNITVSNTVGLNLDNGWPIQYPRESSYTYALFNTFYTANPDRNGSIVIDNEGTGPANHHNTIVGNISEATGSLLSITGDPLPCGDNPFTYLAFNLIEGADTVTDENDADASACSDFTLVSNQEAATATFVNAPTDLELDTGSNGLADGPPGYIQTDFDGNARSATTPDLGAFEQ